MPRNWSGATSLRGGHSTITRVSAATFRLMELKTRADMNAIWRFVISHSANAIPLAHIRCHPLFKCPYLIHEVLSTTRVDETSSGNLKIEPRCRATKLRRYGDLCPQHRFPGHPGRLVWGMPFGRVVPIRAYLMTRTTGITDSGRPGMPRVRRQN